MASGIAGSRRQPWALTMSLPFLSSGLSQKRGRGNSRHCPCPIGSSTSCPIPARNHLRTGSDWASSSHVTPPSSPFVGGQTGVGQAQVTWLSLCPPTPKECGPNKRRCHRSKLGGTGNRRGQTYWAWEGARARDADQDLTAQSPAPRTSVLWATLFWRKKCGLCAFFEANTS